MIVQITYLNFHVLPVPCYWTLGREHSVIKYLDQARKLIRLHEDHLPHFVEIVTTMLFIHSYHVSISVWHVASVSDWMKWRNLAKVCIYNSTCVYYKNLSGNYSDVSHRTNNDDDVNYISPCYSIICNRSRFIYINPNTLSWALNSPNVSEDTEYCENVSPRPLTVLLTWLAYLSSPYIWWTSACAFWLHAPNDSGNCTHPHHKLTLPLHLI